jgi:hypothetical protein
MNFDHLERCRRWRLRVTHNSYSKLKRQSRILRYLPLGAVKAIVLGKRLGKTKWVGAVGEAKMNFLGNHTP